jgi:hypothetical protein
MAIGWVMNFRIQGILVFLVAVLSASGGDGDKTWATLESYCVLCHGEEGKVKGKLDLLVLGEAGLRKDAKALEKMLEAVEFEEMPPEKAKELPAEERSQLAKGLKAWMDAAVMAEKKIAQPSIRRMNRFQYANAVKDLLELKVEVFPLPEKILKDISGYFQPDKGKMPEKMTVSCRPLGKSGLIEPRLAGVTPFPQDLRAEHGFDNRADHLSMSPMLMEAFLKLAKSVVDSPNFSSRTCGVWRELFVQSEGDKLDGQVQARFRKFLTKAYRRPVDDRTLNLYTKKLATLQESGMSYTDAMKRLVAATLASPRFLYLYNIPEAAYERASRLSFLLWGSLPDDTLLEAAGNGILDTQEGVSGQVARMLKDPKLKRFCDSFPSQWLQLDRILSSVPDFEHFRDFYYAAPNYRTSMDMVLEPLLLFETVLVENRSLLDLIDPDFSYRSPRLQKWYGEEISGNKLGGPVTIPFQRVPVKDRRQGGVITSAAMLTMTSGPLESKPITRGAWVTTVIFNNPPEPPPANVPPLKMEPEGEPAKLTLKERFVAHRERLDCAGCHAKLDPLGFALENYDPVGRWRDTYENGLNIDARGILFRKHKFDGPVAFKDAMLAEKDRFVRAFAAHLLSFALCRDLEPSDSPALDKITEETISGEYKIQELLHAVTQCEPFLGN